MTDRQREVIAVIRAFIDSHGMSPTTREIADSLGINPSAVHGHLVRLRRDGLVDWDDGHRRTLRLL